MHAELRDQGQELLIESEIGRSQFVPILGFFETINTQDNEIKDTRQMTGGRIAVYGDSNCIDDSHSHKRN